MNKIFAPALIFIFLACPVWGDETNARANVKCAGHVERVAVYSYEWTDSWYEPKFRLSAYDEGRGVNIYETDKIKFQNGFGVWRNHICFCDWDIMNEQVLDVKCREGRF